MIRLVALAIAVVSITCAPAAVRAAEGSGDKAAETPKSANRPKSVSFHGKVSAVDPVAKVINLDEKSGGRSFQITSQSKITKDGKPAVFADVTVGESVGGLAREGASGKWEVLSLQVGSRPAKPKPGEKTSEAK